jgi:pre-mRNA-processing factor SLU7
VLCRAAQASSRARAAHPAHFTPSLHLSRGDAVALKKAELFAWEAYNATSEADVHVQANPTQTELLKKQAESRKDAVATLMQQRILEAYGGGSTGGGGSSSSGGGGGGGGGASASAASAAPIVLPAELRMGASEAYVDYAAAAEAAAEPPPPPPPRPIARTAAGAVSTLHGPEDVHPSGHRSAWGSWFDVKTKTWGYACCCTVFRDAYCTGEVGRRAAAQSAAAERGAAAPAGGGADGAAAGSKRGREPCV